MITMELLFRTQHICSNNVQKSLQRKLSTKDNKKRFKTNGALQQKKVSN